MTTVREALAATTRQLVDAGLDGARIDAELIVGHVTGLDRVGLRTRDERVLTADEQELLSGLVTRRLANEPVQYLTGRAPFRHIELAVDARVLVPRPETEQLVELALGVVQAAPDDARPQRVVDMCTGSGAIACAIADEAPPGSVEVHATDISPDALAVARGNADALGLGVTLHEGDLWHALGAGQARFDIIVANPPYIPRSDAASLPANVVDHEPHVALFLDGEDALGVIRGILAGLDAHAAPRALVAVEVGAGQAPEVAAAFTDAGLGDVHIHDDLAGIGRMVAGRWGGE